MSIKKGLIAKTAKSGLFLGRLGVIADAHQRRSASAGALLAPALGLLAKNGRLPASPPLTAAMLPLHVADSIADVPIFLGRNLR
jgi:hypothetical protein